MNLRALYDSLSTKIGLLRQKIQHENSVNDYNLNLLLENSVCRILNIMQGLELSNANLIERNFPGVDLIDVDSKQMIQVSTTGTSEKILHTLKQIKKERLYDQYDKLFFFFLSDVKKISSKSKSLINQHTPKEVDFNIDTDIYDTYWLYRTLFNEQDPTKTLQVLSVLDEILELIDSSKKTGYESISVSFDENNHNAYLVVDIILREGINVYISSKILYDQFVDEKHKFIDYLIFSNEITNLKHIKYSIVIVDNEFVSSNNGLKDITCQLLINALKQDSRIQLLNFDNNVNPQLIKERRFKNSIPCNRGNLKFKLTNLIQDFFKEEKAFALNELDIINELKKIYKNFKFEILSPSEIRNYSLFKFDLDGFPDMSIYYLLLNKDYVLGTVKNDLNKIYGKIPKNRIVVLAPKDPLAKTDRRLDNIKKALSTEKTHYVSDHFFEKTLKKEKTHPLLYINDFVDPIIRFQNQNLDGIDAILNWVTISSNSSIAMISGQGGIGKTTLSQKIHDKLIDESNNYHVIFINSSQFIKEFVKIDFDNEQEYDIYNLYRISHGNGGSESTVLIDRKSFEIHYELGNILVVFDGIDELISTIPSFTLKSFLRNVSKIEAGIGRGKIIVNCRDTYINDYIDSLSSEIDNNIDVFELLPFNKELAEEYFDKHFDQPRKIDDCLKFLDEFAQSNSEEDVFIYLPFVVEIVKSFVEKEFMPDEKDFTFRSKYLFENNPNDLIIYKTCNREIRKKAENGFDLTVDMQVEFMVEVAYRNNGVFKEEDFLKILKRIGCKDRLLDVSSGLKDHPFLRKKEDLFFFRFDFLTKYFKSIKIINTLKDSTIMGLDKNILILFAEDLEFYSQITKNILPKIQSEIELYQTNFKKIISNIKKLKIINLIEERKIISNLFMLLVQAYGVDAKEKTRNVLIDLFDESRGNHINNFSLIDPCKSYDFKLDLRSLYFSNTYIKDFEGLLLCDFDSDSYFDESCYIENVEASLDQEEKITVSMSNFDSNIQGDNSVTKSIQNAKSLFEKERVIRITNSLKKFYKSFLEGNLLISKKSLRDIKLNYRYSGGGIDIEKIIEVSENEKLIIIQDEIIEINKKFRIKIMKFIDQNLNFHEFNNVISGINSMIS